MNQDILNYKLKGYCCSQIIMAMGLDKLGKENPDLIQAMAGLCNGVWQEKICGTLSSAVCLLCLADAEEAGKIYISELTEWFEDSFGSTECSDLISGNPLAKAETCPMIIEATFAKICEMLDW